MQLKKLRHREGKSHCKFVAQLGPGPRSLDSSPSALHDAVSCSSLSESISLAEPWKGETVFNYGRFLSTTVITENGYIVPLVYFMYLP